jgi:hypothetical protein
MKLENVNEAATPSGSAACAACASCKYFVPSRENEFVGICRRNPPSVKDRFGGDYWPTVGRGAWCGEYKEASAHGAKMPNDERTAQSPAELTLEEAIKHLQMALDEAGRNMALNTLYHAERAAELAQQVVEHRMSNPKAAVERKENDEIQ